MQGSLPATHWKGPPRQAKTLQLQRTQRPRPVISLHLSCSFRRPQHADGIQQAHPEEPAFEALARQGKEPVRLIFKSHPCLRGPPMKFWRMRLRDGFAKSGGEDMWPLCKKHRVPAAYNARSLAPHSRWGAESRRCCLHSHSDEAIFASIQPRMEGRVGVRIHRSSANLAECTVV